MRGRGLRELGDMKSGINSGSASAAFPPFQSRRLDSSNQTRTLEQPRALLWGSAGQGSARQEDLEESDLSEVQAVWNPGWGRGPSKSLGLACPAVPREATSSGLCQWGPLPLSSPDTSCCQSLVSLRTMLAVTKKKQEKAQSSTKPTQKVEWKGTCAC